MKRSVGLGLLGCACVLWLAGCPKRPDAVQTETSTRPNGGDSSDTSTGVKLPDRPKKEIRHDAQADAALEQARTKAQNQSRRSQVETYLAVRRAYPDTTAGEEALYQAGTLAFDLGDYVNARKEFNELLFENPLFEKSKEARYKLGISALETHAYRDAYQMLSSLAEHATGEEKEKLLAATERAAEGAQLWGNALSLGLKDVEEAQGPEAQALALGRITDLVESRVPFPELVRVQQDLAPSEPAWPLITFKIARVYQHLRDWAHLTEIGQKFLASAATHPYAKDVQDMLAHANPQVHVKPHSVGIILPLSGPAKNVGESTLRGIQLGLKGSGLEVVVKDSAADPSKAAQAVDELATDEGVIAIIGAVATDEAKHAAIEAQALQVPLLSMTRIENITDYGNYVFRNMLTLSAQTRALVDWGTDVMGFKSYGVIYPNGPFGKEIVDDFWNQVDKKGGQIRAAEAYNADQTTFTNEVRKLVGLYGPYLDDRRDYVEAAQDATKNAQDSFRRRKALERTRKDLEPIVDFDALFLPDDWEKVGLIAPALASADIITTSCDVKELEKLKKTLGVKELKTVTLMGINLWSSPKNSDGVPGLIERGTKFVLCSVYVTGFYEDSARPATRKFVSLFRENYKDVPGLYEAYGYDSGRMIRHVLETDKPQTREAMQQSLAALKAFDGATGKILINDKREAERPLFFLTVDLKGLREMSATEKGSGT